MLTKKGSRYIIYIYIPITRYEAFPDRTTKKKLQWVINAFPVKAFPDNTKTHKRDMVHHAGNPYRRVAVVLTKKKEKKKEDKHRCPG